MKRISRKKLQYRFDCLMSKGPIAMTALLGVLTLVIVVVLGVIAYCVSDDSSLGYQLWMSFNHTLDPGTLSGNVTDNVPYVVMMTLATLCGLFLTSILIGIITAGVESKLTDLRRGTSVVQETGHTTIIGFDNDIYTILKELIEANANRKDACIVVLGQQPKEEIEEAIAAHLPNTGTTRIICRSGQLHEAYSLERCNLEASRSVIINVDDDAETIKILLALSSYLKGKKPAYPQLRFVTAMDDSQFLEAAAIAGGILSIKPVLAIEEGVIKILGKARGSKQGNNLLVQKINEAGGVDFEKPVLLGYTGLTDVYLKKYIKDSSYLWEDRKDDLEYELIGSVVGTHAGPGAIATAFFAKE